MYNSTIYDFLKINRKRTNIRLGWSVVCLMFLTLTAMSLEAQNTGTIQIGSGETNTPYGNVTIPITNYSYSYSQQIVTATEYSLAGGIAGNITKIRYKFYNLGTTPSVYGDWDVWIGHIQASKTSFIGNNEYIPISQLTQVFSGNIHTLGTPPPVNDSWFEIEFSTPFDYDGTSNIVVAVHEKTPGWFSPGTAVRTYQPNSNSGIVYTSTTNFNLENSIPTGKLTSIIPQLQFVGQINSCLPVAEITMSNATSTSVDVQWTSQGTETLWDIQWGIGIFDPNNNVGSAIGTATNIISPNYSITGLISDTNYRIFVRANCDGSSSLWKLANFRYDYCIPTGLSASSQSYISAFNTSGAKLDIDYSASSGVGYVDQTSMPFSVTPGETFDWSIYSTNSSFNKFYIWVDWNNINLTAIYS